MLSADAGCLAREAVVVEKAGADWLQIDVMDGDFVPNFSFGPGVVSALRKHTGLPLDVHLMVRYPERFLGVFAEAGADLITVHAEACRDIGRCLSAIRRAGVKAGLAVKPGTDLKRVQRFLKTLDLFLVMSVDPGFGGQKFLEGACGRIKQAREMLSRVSSSAWLQVDGGINSLTAVSAVSAGADSLVAGSAIFKSDNPAKAVKRMRKAITAATEAKEAAEETEKRKNSRKNGCSVNEK